MSLTNIKSKSQAERGFTIVELLIVVVVIAILAAITIVSYNGITNRANASSAASAAGTLQKKIEAYNAEESRYPAVRGDLTGAATDKSYFLNGVNFTGTSADPTEFNVAPTAANGKNTVQFVPCGIRTTTNGAAPTNQSTASPANIATYTGARITYWNFNGGTTTVDVGQTSGNVTVATGDVRAVACPTAR